MAIKDPSDLYDEMANRYRRDPLRLLSSKYFLTCRVAITYAFGGDLSRDVADRDLNASFATVVRHLAQIDDDLVPARGLTVTRRASALRDFCLKSGYLFSSRMTHNEAPTWRVKPDARRAFEAMDDLAEETATFTSAKLDLIQRQMERLEIDFSQNRKQRAQLIQEQIDRLVRERDQVLAGTSDEISPKEAADEMNQLHELMHNLPTDVETVAYQVHETTIAMSAELESKTHTLSEIMARFQSTTFDVLSTTPEGKSYADALSVMSTSRFDTMTERLEALERSPVLDDTIPRGYLTDAWEDILRAIDNVQSRNRVGSNVVMGAARASTTHIGKRSAALRTKALAAISQDPTLAKRLELPVPWQYPRMAYEVRLEFRQDRELTMASTEAPSPDEMPTLDRTRLKILAGPYRLARSNELLALSAHLPDDEMLFVSELLNQLDPTSRRLVEWAGLTDHLISHGAIENGTATWHLVDSSGQESSWSGCELAIRKSDLVRACARTAALH